MLGGKRLYDLHKLAFDRHKGADINFYAFHQNYPILLNQKRMASPKADQTINSQDFSDTLHRLYLMMFKANQLERRYKNSTKQR
ncbi:MAG: hypothetical protein NZO16_06835 [Deltaproteobacteria bacterium]|nr:hypothetical protein [Deltaproteobacteria bacterium]